MIITHIMGGIGNQLFQYALGRCLAYKNKADFKLEIFDCEAGKNSHHNYYRLAELNVLEKFATLNEAKSLTTVQEKDATIFEPEVLNLSDNVFLYGYWQNEKYFEDVEEILRKELTPKNPFGKISSIWKEKILSAECAVSLHIRHGDFLTPLIRGGEYGKILPEDYYLTCIAEIKKNFPNLTVFVFSDDLEWAQNNFKPDVPTEFVQDCESDIEELFLMSYCKHNICANSTFSWWGAWLNQNPDKKVFYPQDISMLQTPLRNSFYVPKKFTFVPVDYTKNPHIEFPPMLSIILYVENNLDTVNISLNSILSQNFKDYELIIIDSSTDNSGKFCRRFAENENVTVLKEKSSCTKFAAWNKGLKCARGYYVLFLTAKDFIFPESIRMLAQFSYNFIKYYTEMQKNRYLSFQNYNEVYPNILCSIQNLAQDADGDIVINTIQGKSFSRRVDPAFRELRTAYELKIDDRNKISLLALQKISNLIGNKFFKLKFLNDNNIHFEEKLAASAELKFLTDAFLYSENITFIAPLFYGSLN